MTGTIPLTMKAWLYSSAGKLDEILKLEPKARMPPVVPLKPNQLLIQTISASINPADYKMPEMGSLLLRLFFSSFPISPGTDFCGRVAAVGSTAGSSFKTGDIVYGCIWKPTRFGSLAEYLVCNSDQAVALPDGVDPDIASTVGVAGQTAYQSIVPYVQSGDNVFITAGSGGCGTYAIQLAKILGCHVTTTCSGKNVQYLKDLGADEVIDYTAQDVVGTLKSEGKKYSHVADFVGLPSNLYKESHHFLIPGKVFMQAFGASPSMLSMIDRMLRPAILGGGRSKFRTVMIHNSHQDMAKLGEYIKANKIKVNFDGVYDFEDVPKAFKRLESGRTRGKIVIHVSEKP